MAYSEQVSRAGILADVIRRIADAALPHGGIGAPARPRKVGRHPRGPLDAGILGDIGACREYQDYAASAAVSARPDRRLHRIAEAARWTSPR